MTQGIVKFVPCPADNCERGEVHLSEWRDEDGDGPIALAGFCDSCGNASVECSECEAVTALIDEAETKCDGCDAVYQLVSDRKALPEGFRRVR